MFAAVNFFHYLRHLTLKPHFSEKASLTSPIMMVQACCLHQKMQSTTKTKERGQIRPLSSLVSFKCYLFDCFLKDEILVH